MSISFAKVPTTIVDVGIGRSATDAKLKVILDVTNHLETVEHLSPGLIDKCKRLAVEDARGEEIRMPGTRPDFAIGLAHGDGERVIDLATATLRSMFIRIGKAASTVTVHAAFTGAASKAEWAALREAAYGSNVFGDVSFTPPQPKARKTRKRKPVDVVAQDDRQTVIPGTENPSGVTTAEFEAAIRDGIAAQKGAEV